MAFSCSRHLRWGRENLRLREWSQEGGGKGDELSLSHRIGGAGGYASGVRWSWNLSGWVHSRHPFAVLTAITFRFNAANGASYPLGASTDLENWAPIEDGNAGNSGVVMRFNTTERQVQRFFRERRE